MSKFNSTSLLGEDQIEKVLVGNWLQSLFALIALTGLFLVKGHQFSGMFFDGNWKILSELVIVVELLLPVIVLAFAITAFLVSVVNEVDEDNSSAYKLEVLGCNLIAILGYGWLYWALLSGTGSLLGLGSSAIASSLIFYGILGPAGMILITGLNFGLGFLWCMACDKVRRAGAPESAE